MRIDKLRVFNFKCFKGVFEISFDEGMNLLVGDNEAGKSTILEAIHLVLTGYYQGRPIGSELSQYLFNNEVVEEYLQSLRSKTPQEPPIIKIEIYLSGTNEEIAEYKGDDNLMEDDFSGFSLTIGLDEEMRNIYNAYIKSSNVNSLPIEYYKITWSSFARDTALILRNIPVKSVLIDTSSYRNVYSSDPYITKIILNKLTDEQEVEVSQAHRSLREQFKDAAIIKEINTSLQSSELGLIGKQIELSIDLGSRNAWESSLSAEVNQIPLQYMGKGLQQRIKISVALSKQKAEKAEVILIEEPENHLSHTNLNSLLESMEKHLVDKQVICSTHSSFVANKLGLTKIRMIDNRRVVTFSEINQETTHFFQKVAGYDTLRFVLCKRAILVEGASDELIVQRAYLDKHGKLPIQDGIEVISVGTAFMRFIEIAEKISKDTVVIIDNDGDLNALESKYEPYLGTNEKDFIRICYCHEVFTGNLKIGEKDFNYNTLEPLIVKENGLIKMNSILGKNYKTENDLHKYMRANKTDVALKIFSTTENVDFPEYIKNAVE